MVAAARGSLQLVHGRGRHSGLDSEPGELGTLRYGLGPADVALRGGALRLLVARALGLVALGGRRGATPAPRALVLVENRLASRDPQRRLRRRRVVADARNVEDYGVPLVGGLAGHRTCHGASR